MSGESLRRCGRTRWFAVAAAALVALIYVANLLFYAGQTFEGGLHWRLEYGRLTIRLSPADRTRPEPFWVDVNNGGWRWPARWRRYRPGRELILPPWMPLGLCLAWCAVAWRRRSTAPDAAGS